MRGAFTCPNALNGFANTDLAAQLTQRGIEKIILVGCVGNTCIEFTARLGMELGYYVTPPSPH